ncbi:MaoC/PaaZ C-terminal domain-containing protein [Paraburkholderia sp. ZP32-5]|uniref:MaoC/PaaZ C-terminal domain-containing protein n=1 Tax=Paraburkholderia sp. ZP32-5 TaxID=2883245 RepID=UPI001F28EAFA|nr:MaoC/PaaZ C-terminal domain-containing protein [Paraburkholderia sp. ZP32-5]
MGTVIPERTLVVNRVDVLRHSGASLDFSAAHWSERVARKVGFPDVVAQGLLTIGKSVAVVTDWIGDPGALIEYSVQKFTRPVVVPDDGVGTQLQVSGVVEEKLTDKRVVVRLHARCAGQEVMGAVRAVVRLA